MAGETLVLNASPIITLAKVSHLDLVELLADTILVPDAVAIEVLSGPSQDPARAALEAGWGNTVTVGDVPSRILEWSLGAGETAVLAVTLTTPGARAVVDDGVARNCARALDIPITGTLGLVLRAKVLGHIDSAANVIQALIEADLRVSEDTIRAALAHVGEDWPI